MTTLQKCNNNPLPFPLFLRRRPFIPITTQRLTLRLPREADVPAFVQLFSEPEVVEHLSTIPYPYDSAHGMGKLRRAEAAYRSGEALFLVIEHRDEGEVIGTLELNSKGELGYALAKPYWRQGCGQEAVTALLEFTFRLWKLPQVMAKTKVSAAASQGLLRKLGFMQATSEQPTPSQASNLLYTLSPDMFKLQQQAVISTVPPLFAAAVFLLKADGQFLVNQLPPHKPYPGTWELPGGKLEPGETPEVAAVREMDEELGITLQAHHLEPLSFASHAFGDKPVVVFFLLCRTWAGEPWGKEGQTIAWVTLEGMPSYSPPAPDLEAFHRLASLLDL